MYLENHQLYRKSVESFSITFGTKNMTKICPTQKCLFLQFVKTISLKQYLTGLPTGNMHFHVQGHLLNEIANKNVVGVICPGQKLVIAIDEFYGLLLYGETCEFGENLFAFCSM